MMPVLVTVIGLIRFSLLILFFFEQRNRYHLFKIDIPEEP